MYLATGARDLVCSSFVCLVDRMLLMGRRFLLLHHLHLLWIGTFDLKREWLLTRILIALIEWRILLYLERSGLVDMLLRIEVHNVLRW